LDYHDKKGVVNDSERKFNDPTHRSQIVTLGNITVVEVMVAIEM